ncbi:hypothetical protein AYO44_08830 [Planctomycetaceae bacterium SCGC AG-212-F19]|nr:hypothetical protein AYO44_08830 [Planctomycetaceae bacterium SCGC AG-212-F19]
MRRVIAVGILAVVGGAIPTPARTDEKAKYAELSQLLQQTVVAHIPKQIDDFSDWNKTIPVTPGGLRLPGAKRTVLKVGDKDEWPNGTWKRTKIWFDDPAKDIRVKVKDFRKDEGKPYQVQIEAKVTLHGERERQQWTKGILLLAVTAQADAVVTITLDCEASAAFNIAKLPPELQIAPKVVDTRLTLNQFQLNNVANVIRGELARELGNELQGTIQGMMHAREPQMTEFANKAIAKSLKDGKVAVSAAMLLKVPMPSKKE